MGVETHTATLRSHVLVKLAVGPLGCHFGALLLRRNFMYKNANSFTSLTSICQCQVPIKCKFDLL